MKSLERLSANGLRPEPGICLLKTLLPANDAGDVQRPKPIFLD